MTESNQIKTVVPKVAQIEIPAGITKLVLVVPKQVCPICQGEGILWTTTEESETCPTCGGARVIPMAIDEVL